MKVRSREASFKPSVTVSTFQHRVQMSSVSMQPTSHGDTRHK